ncbi:MAG: hypothetical protein LBD41_07720, partial [Clostridiales Family XIII bacterium]|nr:hypothetical protein [Clostridiales Family XIII bacterium]
MKKVLILSISTGQGHHAVGKTLKKKYEAEGHEVRFLDAYEYVWPALAAVLSKGYIATTKYLPTVMARTAYDLMLKKDTPSKKLMPISLINAGLARRLRRYIKIYDPDLIICTHVLAAMLAERLKFKKSLRAITCGIVTDFTVHPLWQNVPELDFFVTPSELLNFQMEKKGIKKEKIFSFGLPVKEEFVPSIDKSIAREKLNLSKRLNTVLIMGGSMGHGNLVYILDRIDGMGMPLQGMVVCGNNKKIFNELKRKNLRKNFK